MAKAVLTEYTLRTEYSLPSPVRIIHLSDLHSRKADDILLMVSQQKPDLIVISGDTFERYDNRPQYDYHKDNHFHPVKWLVLNAIHYTFYLLDFLVPQQKRSSTQNAYDILSTLSKIAPVCLGLGNHEFELYDEDLRFLKDHHITLLDNADTQLHIKGFSFLLGGMSSWNYEPFLEAFLKKKGFKILMCHQPERFEQLLEDSDIKLVLSGHTHGGQVRIGKKGRGFFVPGQGIFGKYAHGRFFDGRLIVSAGCANTVTFPRLFNPREVVLITVTGGKNETV